MDLPTTISSCEFVLMCVLLFSLLMQCRMEKKDCKTTRQSTVSLTRNWYMILKVFHSIRPSKSLKKLDKKFKKSLSACMYWRAKSWQDFLSSRITVWCIVIDLVKSESLKSVPKLGCEVKVGMKLLEGYPWPGSIEYTEVHYLLYLGILYHLSLCSCRGPSGFPVIPTGFLV